jgi:hypothetical protein
MAKKAAHRSGGTDLNRNEKVFGWKTLHQAMTALIDKKQEKAGFGSFVCCLVFACSR